MSESKRAALLAGLMWALAAAMGPVCYGGQEASGPAAPDLSALARQARPAVGVLVTFDADGDPISQGTAFFVRADGVALTCWHVLEGAASASIGMESGASFPVEGILASDPVRDLALFKVAGKGLPCVPLGESSTLRPGQRVVAITAPQGLENTIADGLVSAVRDLPSGSVVQVSVPLSPGSSGGPIFDLSGRVVAVAAAVLTEGQALNFAIPINAAKPLLAKPGTLTPLAPAEQPADLEDWLRQRPTSPSEAAAYDLWLQGRDANLSCRYEEAVGHLRAGLVLDPSLYQAHCCLGNTYGELGRYEEAIAAFREAIRLKPDYAEAHYNLWVTYGKLSITYGKWDHPEEMSQAFNQSIRLKPDLMRGDYGIGFAYCKVGRYQQEMEASKQAIRLKPDDAEAHYNLGVAYGHLCRWREEAAAYREAIRLKPDYAEAYYNLGVAYGHLCRRREEAAAYREAIRLKPDDVMAHYMLAMAYHYLGDRAAALDEYRLLKDLDPVAAEVLSALLYP